MIFALLTLLCALFVSVIAAYYSVVGLIAIFSASPIPIAIMGASLEGAKLVVASWLYKNWEDAPKLLKYYFTVALVILMFITSIGIFGFLSKAHNDQSLVSGEALAKLEVYNEKIKVAKENIESNRKQLKQMDDAVDQVMARSTSEQGADKANNIRKSQQKDRIAIAKEIETNQKLIATLNDESIPLRTEVRKVEAEVGPLKYIAALIYGDSIDQTILEKAVRLVIILIVLVFDPLAVLLVIAANYSLKKQAEEDINFANENGKFKKVDVTSFDPVPMNKEELVNATHLYHRDQDSM